jgi:hypothetical protein
MTWAYAWWLTAVPSLAFLPLASLAALSAGRTRLADALSDSAIVAAALTVPPSLLLHWPVVAGAGVVLVVILLWLRQVRRHAQRGAR